MNTNRRTVTVNYTIPGDRAIRVARVILIKGYSDEADIPRVLAVKHYSTNERADDIFILSVRDN